MKKMFLILTVLVLCFTQTAYAKTTERSEKAGAYVAMIGVPAIFTFMAINSAFIGTPEIAGAVLIAYGAYRTHKGDWGKDGTEAIKNCVGTHVNDNCAHLKLSELGTGQLIMNGGSVGHN